MRSLPTLLPLLLCLPHLAQAADTDEWRYTVQRGDTLWSIARQHLRSIAHVPALQQKNAIRDPYVLAPGSVVRIPTQWMRQHTGKATVTDLIGSASLGNGKQQTALVNGNSYPLQTGHIISTGPNSLLKLLLEDGSLVSIGANARFTIQQAVHYPSTGANATWLNIERGSVDNHVSKNPLMPNRHTIQTPSAITAVRGTIFRVNVDDDSRSATEVSEGQVEVSAAGYSEQIGGGFGSVTRRGEVPGKSTLLPPPPALGQLDGTQAFSPAILQWPPVAGISRYPVQLLRTAPERRIVGDSTATANHSYPALDNGEYRLLARSELDNGLQGRVASQNFRVHAFPTPPLVVSPAPDARLRGLDVRFVVSGDTGSRYRLRLARDAAFSQPLLHDFSRQDNRLTLPDGGHWFWQIARLDAKQQAGPYSQTYRLQADTGWWRASHYRGTTLSARPYPLANARYQLRLTQLDQPQPALQLDGDTPRWQLAERLFPGRYRVSYRVTTPDGYLAQEPDDILLLD